MSDAAVEAIIDDFVLGLLLRYFRAGTAVVPGPTAEAMRPDDLDHLRMRWAVSGPVRRLAGRLASHPQELRAILSTVPRAEDGRVRGRLDARATALRRLLTGHPTVSVGHEPVRSFDSGPNQVLLWVLAAARRWASRFVALTPEDSPQRPHAIEVAAELEAVARTAHVRQAREAGGPGRYPGAAAVVEASRSRLLLYVAAAEAYRTLRCVEAGDPDALREVLRDTLVGPTEVWRRFELAVALAAADALAAALHKTPALGLLAGGDRLVARIGCYAIHWQSLTTAYVSAPPEPSEAVTARVLAAYGFRASGDRPDVVVFDESTASVVAVLEAKYFAGGERDAPDALRDASAQLVRYVRGYRAPGDLDGLLGTSAVALVRLGGIAALNPPPPGVPWLVDLEGLTRQRLAGWADACLAASKGRPAAAEPLPG